MNRKQPTYNVSAAERAVINRIVDRAMGGAARSARRVETEFDIIAAHANGNPLRLEALLEADETNFAADIFGICRHLNRMTGELMSGFRPRYSA